MNLAWPLKLILSFIKRQEIVESPKWLKRKGFDETPKLTKRPEVKFEKEETQSDLRKRVDAW